MGRGEVKTWNAARCTRANVNAPCQKIGMAAVWCVGRYLWILEKHVHIIEQPLDEYKRNP